jgi:hypothetical protein
MRKPTKQEAEKIRKGIQKFILREFGVEITPTLSWYTPNSFPTRGIESAEISLPFFGSAHRVAERFNARARNCRLHVQDSSTLLVWALEDGN